MINFASYDPHTGRILWCGAIPESQLPAYGPHVYMGTADPASQYIDTRTGQLCNMPPRPSPSHEFDYQTRGWRANLDAAWRSVRAQRDTRLAACDYVTLPDVPMAPTLKSAWLTYRQALRDVTKQPDPLAIVWPLPPSN